MSTADDRLAVIQQTYEDANDNESGDLAQAKTAADVAAIQANVANARLAYYSAAADDLSSTAATAEAAYGDAQTALQQVKDARTNASAIADLLTKLNNATTAATTLAKAAKAV